MSFTWMDNPRDGEKLGKSIDEYLRGEISRKELQQRHPYLRADEIKRDTGW